MVEPETGETSINKMPVDRRKMDRRDQIIDATTRLLGKIGLEGLTVRAVLNETGINRRSYYEHFSGKDELALAVLAKSVEMTAQDCRESIRGVDDPFERLRILINLIASGYRISGEDREVARRRGASLAREQIRLAEAYPKHLDAALEPLLALICRIIGEGVERGQMRQRAPERLAKFVYSLLSTAVIAELLADAPDAGSLARRKVLAEEIWEFCHGALLPTALTD